MTGLIINVLVLKSFCILLIHFFTPILTYWKTKIFNKRQISTLSFAENGF